ncbi:uncharacterized protein LOC119164242 [Rhipicephalus microplus]|uniref:uncharacterized protein LOC119164242 n=1 Tax=Rhipicephalus microplus TaxID=6941 RepID=UPI003F6AF242
MQCTTVLTAAILCTVASGQEYAGSAQCGCLEVPATSTRRRDKFCRPHLTDPAERRRYRSCVCRLGVVRNSWGDCITRQECTSCKCFPDRDFNVCGRECPLVCNEPMSRSCSKSCAFGCDCVSGFVRSSGHRGRCVKATKCGFSCPQFSTFQFCSSTCRPKCGRRPRRSCVTRCTRGDCVCNQGYAEVEHNGETICVPQGQCSQYVQLAPPMTPGGHGNMTSGGAVFVPGTPTMPVNSGVITGGSGGIPVPGSVGINGNVGSGVFVPAAPSTPVIPGVVTGGASGPPLPGSVGNNGFLSAGGSSGGIVSIPGAPSTPVNTGFVMGGAAGTPVPGSVGNNGASPTSNVPSGGTGSVGPSAGGGYQPGLFGSGGLSHTLGGAGVGTYSPGGVASRLPGSIDAQGQPSRGTSGVGTVGGGISVGNKRPNIAIESGENTGVDAAGIPIAEGEIRPGGGATAAGRIPPNEQNGNSGTGVVVIGLLPGKIPPQHIANTGVNNVGISGGNIGHGGVDSLRPTTPGINIEKTRPSGTVTSASGSLSVGTTGIPIINIPASGNPSKPVIASPSPPPNLTSPVYSGTTVSVVTPAGTVSVSKVPSVASVEAGTVSNGLNGNVAVSAAIPSANSATTGSTLQPVGTTTLTGTSLGNNVLGVIGNGKPNAPSLAPAGPSGTIIIALPAGTPSLTSLTGVSPQSSGMGSPGVNSGIPSGTSSAVSTGIAATGGITNGMPIVGVPTTGMVTGTSVGDKTASMSSVGTTLGTISGGVNGANSFGPNTRSGASITTQPAALTLPVSAGIATAGTAAVIGGALGGPAAIPMTVATMRATGTMANNSAAQ